MVLNYRTEQNILYRETQLTLDKKLFLLLDMLDNFNVNLQSVGHGVSRSQSEPLGQGDIGHAVTLVDLDPDQFLGLRCVFDVVTWGHS